MGAVIAALQRKELGPLALFLHLPVLPGESKRGFNRIGAAGREEDARHVLRLQHLGQRVAEFDQPVVRRSLE